MAYKVIDLFAGAGGLSNGFNQTGKFDIVLAVENNLNAQKTYKRNHKSADMYDDIRNLNYKEILNKYGKIDVIIGGPPCQGFSNANRQKNNLINSNNELIKEYVNAILKVKPGVFVMENVGMLSSSKHKFYYSMKDKEHVDALSLSMNEEILEIELPAVHANQILQDIRSGYEFNRLLLPDKYFKPLSIMYRYLNNHEKYKKTFTKKKHEIIRAVKYCLEFYNNDEGNYYAAHFYELSKSLILFIGMNSAEFKDALISFVLLQRSLSKLCELTLHSIIVDRYKLDGNVLLVHVKSYIVVEYITGNVLLVHVKSYIVVEYIKKALSRNYVTTGNIVNAAHYGAPQNRDRYIMIGVKRNSQHIKELDLPEAFVEECNFFTVKDAIIDLEGYIPEQEICENSIQSSYNKINGSRLLKYLCDSENIYNHINTKSTEAAKERFRKLREGQNFHNLSNDLKSTYSSPERTQNSIYLRLSYDKPSGTVLNTRKSMWVHPKIDRALSIREAARLQTFPDSFVFEGSKDSQYQQIGNAVPPLLGRAIAEKVLALLGDTPVSEIHKLLGSK